MDILKLCHNNSFSDTDNSSHFKAIAFIDKYLYNNTVNGINKTNGQFVLISNPFYSWIPGFVFDLKNVYYVDYYDGVSVKANKVVMCLILNGNIELNII